MQNLVKSFLELVQKGDIDAVMQERERQGIDVATLADEANFKQGVMFSAAVIKDEQNSLKMM